MELLSLELRVEGIRRVMCFVLRTCFRKHAVNIAERLPNTGGRI